MADDESDAPTQRLSLLDEDGEVQENVEPPKQQQRRGFWGRFLRKKRPGGGANDKGPQEDDALLGSGLDNFHDQDDSALLDRSQRLRNSYREESNHDDEADDDFGSEAHSSSFGEYESFSLLPSGDDDDDDDDDDQNLMYRSAPLLEYNANVVHYTDEDDDDDDDDNTSSGSDDGESRGSEEGGDLVASLSPMPLRPKLGQRSFSMSTMSSRFSDRRNNNDDNDTFIDSNGRKQLVGRIEGFGNNAPMPDIVSPRTFRQRIQALTRGRMQKMAIGNDDDSAQNSLSWSERVENKVVDFVETALADPVTLEEYNENYETQNNNLPPARPPSAQDSGKSINKIGSARRKEFGNDETYILFLECELQNTELELASWKRRVKELEAEVTRLGGDDHSDDDLSSAGGSAKEEGESEIEWQSEPIVEGNLIDVDGTEIPTATDKKSSIDATGAPVDATSGPDEESEIEWQTEPLKVGVLVDVDGAEESVAHNAICETESNQKNVPEEVVADDGDSRDESSEEESDDDSTEAETAASPAEGVLIDISKSETYVPEANLLDLPSEPATVTSQGLDSQPNVVPESNLLELRGVQSTVNSSAANSTTESPAVVVEKSDGDVSAGSDAASETDDGSSDDEEENENIEEVKEGVLIDIGDNQDSHTSPLPSKSTASPSSVVPEGGVDDDNDDVDDDTDDDDDDDSESLVEEATMNADVPEGNLLDLPETTTQPTIDVSG